MKPGLGPVLFPQTILRNPRRSMTLYIPSIPPPYPEWTPEELTAYFLEVRPREYLVEAWGKFPSRRGGGVDVVKLCKAINEGRFARPVYPMEEQ